MNFLHLKYLIEVEKYESISKAAQHLYINQPRLSKIIKEIEEKKLSYFISSNNIYYYVDFHNMFIQYLSQLGIFGIIIILLIFYYMFKIKINNSRLNDLKNLFVILYLLWSIVALTFHINTSLTFFILFLGLFLKYSINSKEQLNVI